MTKKVVKRVTTETVDEEGNRKVVVKEHPPKETVKRRSSSSSGKRMTAKEREELLIENFVGLQHAMTNMSIKFGALSDNISKLLQIFEESAKNFVSGGKPDDKEMLEKINSLLNQNKTIAKGLVLMEGKLRGRSEIQPPMPPMPPMRNNNSAPQNYQNYQNSSPSQQSSGPKPLPSI